MAEHSGMAGVSQPRQMLGPSIHLIVVQTAWKQVQSCHNMYHTSLSDD